METETRPHIRFARTAIPAAVVIVAVIACGILLRSWVGWTSVEMDMLRRLNIGHTPVLDWIALGINWLFAPAVATVVVLLATGWILFDTRLPRTAIQFLLIVVIPTLGAAVIKLIVHRPRPDIPSLTHILVLEPGGLSFPSGHTSFAASILLGLIVVTARHGRRPLLIGVAVVVVLGTAASRVYLGVHYPSDVVASIVYSIAAVTLANAAWTLMMSHWTKRRSGPHAGAAHGGAQGAH